jgi:hypothetical protein
VGSKSKHRASQATFGSRTLSALATLGAWGPLTIVLLLTCRSLHHVLHMSRCRLVVFVQHRARLARGRGWSGCSSGGVARGEGGASVGIALDSCSVGAGGWDPSAQSDHSKSESKSGNVWIYNTDNTHQESPPCALSRFTMTSFVFQPPLQEAVHSDLAEM